MAKKTKKNNATHSTPASFHASPSITSDVPSSLSLPTKQQARREAKSLGLNKGNLPNSIREIISTLTEAGFEAYIVGGGVRDALLGLQPKDFDAVTNANPNQIKEVFGKRCRIIGRRFQLCHVYSGRDMIEVATFRAPPTDNKYTTEDGMITRDNVWGDIYQDVVRRDFSINALYYQPFEGVVYDFCGGLADIAQRKLRLLGHTQKRVEEDPVRLLRALRFKAKLGFSFDDALEQQFHSDSWQLLAQVSPHRLYDETQKMFTGGYLTALLPLLFDYRAFDHLLFRSPETITPLLEQITINTDKRIAQGKTINPAFYYAAMLWENYLYLLLKLKTNLPFVEAQNQAANKILEKQRQITAMPKFAEQFIKDVWLMQPRLAEPRKKNLYKLFENPRFRAGFDFLLMREQVEAKNQQLAKLSGTPVTLDNEPTHGMGHWWAWFQTLNVKQQQQAVDEFDLEAVKLRFANLLPHTAEATGSNPSAATLPSKSPKRAKLTLQEQQEKAQLAQLSLAHAHQSTTPAKSLWQHPSLPEQTWQSQPTSHAPSESKTPSDAQASSPTATINTQPTVPPINNRHSSRQRKNAMDSSTTNNIVDQRKVLGTALPERRRRREPSSLLSVIEQQLANQTLDNKPANTLETSTLATTQANQKIPAKRTRKKVVERVEIPSEKVAETVETVINAAEKPPVKRGRKPKAVAENAEVVETKTETLPKKIPVKRTRKKPTE